MIGDARDRSIRIARAALRIRVFETPLDDQVRAELGDEKLLRAGRVGARPIQGAERRVIVAVGAEAAVVVVLDDNRVRPVVLEDRGRRIPTEAKSAQIVAIGTEVHQMTLGVVVAAVGAEEDATVWCHGWAGRLIVQNSPGACCVLRRVISEDRGVAGGSEIAAAARLAVRWECALWGRNAAAVMKSIPERGGPLQRQVGVEGKQE